MTRQHLSVWCAALALVLAGAFAPAAHAVSINAPVATDCGQETYTVGNYREVELDPTGGACTKDIAVLNTLTTQSTTLTQMANSLTILANAAGSVTPTGSVNGACKLVLNHAGKFYGGSGTVNGASYVFLMNLAALPSDPYTPVAGDLLVTPITVPAGGTWSIAPMTPITASVGVAACVSSTLYSAGVLTETKVTSTAATNNSIVLIAQ